MRKTILVTIVGLLIVNLVQSETITFLTVHPGTGTDYDIETNSIRWTQTLNAASGVTNIKFTSANPADVTFSGNNVAGQLTYTLNGQTISKNGVISRPSKTGNTDDALYFCETTVLGGKIPTGNAWLLVVPGRESYITKSPTKTSSDPIDNSLNDLITIQNSYSDPVITSDGGGDSASKTIAENISLVTTVKSIVYSGSTKIYSITGGVDASKFSINAATGVLTFISAPDYENPADNGFNNVYDVQVTVTDSQGSTDAQNIAVTITNTNELTLAVNDAGAVNDDATLTVSEANGVIKNTTTGDSDQDGDVLTVTNIRTGTEAGSGTSGTVGSVLTGTYGSLTLIANGSYSYIPNQATVNNLKSGHSVIDYFTYSISDGNGGTDTAQLTITINGVNDSPVAINDINTTFTKTAVNGQVLTNDSDSEGDNLTVTSQTNASTKKGGIVTLNTNGTYTYTPATDFIGKDSFTYEVCDDGTPSKCTTAEVTIDVMTMPVTGGIQILTAVNDNYQGIFTQTITGQLLANDLDSKGNTLSLMTPLADTDGDGIAIESITFEAGTSVYGTNSANQLVPAGTLTIKSNGTFSFVPYSGFKGSIPGVYSAYNGTDTDQASFLITVFQNSQNANTVYATDDSFIGYENTQISGNLLTNDFDPESKTLTLNTTPVTNPAHGTVTLNADGTFVYNPSANYFGPDQFIYEVCDNGTPNACDRATVYINIAEMIPDITSIITAIPNVMNGTTNFIFIIKVTELNLVNTNSLITVRIPKDTRWTFNGPYDSNLTTLDGITLNNSIWGFSQDDINYIFTTTSVIPAGTNSVFGFRATFSAPNTKGIYTITSQIDSGSGGENRIDNNVDAEKIDYFIY